MAKVKILTAAEAANLVEDGMTVSTNGFVACDLPEELTSALEKRFLETGSPKNLTYFYAAGQGNRDGSGADHFAHEGMTSTVIAGHYNMAPKLGELIMQNSAAGGAVRRPIQKTEECYMAKKVISFIVILLPRNLVL